jgi:hypothetical protein
MVGQCKSLPPWHIFDGKRLCVIGYQPLTFFYGNWPTVSFHYVFSELFGGFPMLEWWQRIKQRIEQESIARQRQ